VAIADRCRFSLDELTYQYPNEVAEPGKTPQETLARLTWEGAARRFPDGVTPEVKAHPRP
jgi:error-prone DNA polymerase